jgi:hypothetical protein
MTHEHIIKPDVDKTEVSAAARGVSKCYSISCTHSTAVTVMDQLAVNLKLFLQK